MARVDERLKDVSKKIAKVHNPIDENGLYNINKSEKIDAICKYIKSIGLEYIVDENYGILVSNSFKEDENRKKAISKKIKESKFLFTSHIDLIEKFNNQKIQANLTNQFSNISGYEDYDQKIVGALDNTITNCILISLLEMRKINFSDDLSDILVLFSIGEEMKNERGFKEPKGVKNFIKNFHSKIKKQKIKCINLDVTAWEYHDYINDEDNFAFIEYDTSMKQNKLRKDYKYSRLKDFEIFDEFEDLNFCDYGKDGTYDDLLSITKFGLSGVSICLNTYGVIHSKENFTYMKHIDVYFNLLNNILQSRKGL